MNYYQLYSYHSMTWLQALRLQGIAAYEAPAVSGAVFVVGVFR